MSFRSPDQLLVEAVHCNAASITADRLFVFCSTPRPPRLGHSFGFGNIRSPKLGTWGSQVDTRRDLMVPRFEPRFDQSGPLAFCIRAKAAVQGHCGVWKDAVSPEFSLGHFRSHVKPPKLNALNLFLIGPAKVASSAATGNFWGHGAAAMDRLLDRTTECFPRLIH